MSSKKSQDNGEEPQPQKKVKPNEEQNQLKQSQSAKHMETAQDSSFVDDGEEEEDVLVSDSNWSYHSNLGGDTSQHSSIDL